MKTAFGRTKFLAFQKSPLKARARLPVCDNSDITSPDGLARSSYVLSYRIQADPLFPGDVLGLDPYFKSWDSLGYFLGNGHAFRTPKLHSRGRWRVDIRLQTFYPIAPDPTHPGHGNLYIDLFRYNNNTGGSLEIALQNGAHGVNMIPASSLPAGSSLDPNSNPNLMNDPSAVSTTRTFDLSNGPMDISDYIVIGEVQSYCHPVFYIDWTYLTGTRNIFNNQLSQSNGGSPLPGDWILPAGLSSSVVLAQIDLTFTRIPVLNAVFKLQRLSGLTYRFTSISLGSPTTYDWNWGDGSTHGTTAVADHSFPGTGTYNVKLTIGNAYGDSANHTVTLILRLDAAFTFTPRPHPQVAFDATTSHNAVAFDWDFGDGSAHGSGVTVTHAYPVLSVQRNYTVTLVVNDGFGHTANVSHVVTVTPQLIAQFTNNNVGSPPHTVQFTDQSTGLLASWAWTFTRISTGATVTSASQNPLVTFPASGNWVASLIVTDQQGFTATAQHLVSVP